jgi:hypothetical protein
MLLNIVLGLVERLDIPEARGREGGKWKVDGSPANAECPVFTHFLIFFFNFYLLGLITEWPTRA